MTAVEWPREAVEALRRVTAERDEALEALRQVKLEDEGDAPPPVRPWGLVAAASVIAWIVARHGPLTRRRLLDLYGHYRHDRVCAGRSSEMPSPNVVSVYIGRIDSALPAGIRLKRSKTHPRLYSFSDPKAVLAAFKEDSHAEAA